MIRNAREREYALKRSKFRSRFRLDEKDCSYIAKIGFERIRSHASDFVRQRLVPANPPNEGKQTPYKGHPVFKAQHATATCCRGCLEKWYGIERNRDLTAAEEGIIVQAIMNWLDEKWAVKVFFKNSVIKGSNEKRNPKTLTFSRKSETVPE